MGKKASKGQQGIKALPVYRANSARTESEDQRETQGPPANLARQVGRAEPVRWGPAAHPAPWWRERRCWGRPDLLDWTGRQDCLGRWDLRVRWGLGETWDPGGLLGRTECEVRLACRAKRVGLETLEPRASRDRRVMLGWRVNSAQQGSRALLAWPASQVSRGCPACLEMRGRPVVAVTRARLARTGRMGLTERLDFLGRLGTVASLERTGAPVSRGCQARLGPREMPAHQVCPDTRDRQENRGTPGWWDRRVLAAIVAQQGLRVTLGKQGLWEAEGRRERWETQGRQANRDLWVIRANEDLGVQLGSRAARDRRACQGCREVQVLQGHPVRPVHLETPSLWPRPP